MIFSITATEEHTSRRDSEAEANHIMKHVRNGIIEITAIEELVQICRDTGYPVIVSIDKYKNNFDEDVEDYELEIYNDYRE